MSDENLSNNLLKNEENNTVTTSEAPDEALTLATEQTGNNETKTNENVESLSSKIDEESVMVEATTSNAENSIENVLSDQDYDDGDDEDDDDTEMEENALRIDYEDDESFEEHKNDINGSGKKEHGSSSIGSGDKRKLNETDWSSEDEEAFVGFGDSIGENSSRIAFISGENYFYFLCIIN